jgi:hypothetical protein
MSMAQRQAPSGDALALKNSGLNEFLFAELGTERNGSTLTVLSTLARLGKDPWAQASEWARMPGSAAVDGLTDSILRMPLCAPDFIEARATAGRLVRLLPRPAGTTGQIAGRTVAGLKIPEWVPLAVFGILLGLAVVAGTFAAAPMESAPVVKTVEHGGQ